MQDIILLQFDTSGYEEWKTSVVPKLKYLDKTIKQLSGLGVGVKIELIDVQLPEIFINQC